MTMTMQEICRHEYAEMMIRHTLGYDQHDEHVWGWMLHELELWEEEHPISIVLVSTE